MDDLDLLAQFLAGELPPDEAARVEARLRDEPALRQLRADLEQIDALATELPAARLDPLHAERLVQRALPPRVRPRTIAAVALAAAAALLLTWALRGDVATLTVSAGTVTVDGRTFVAGESVRAPHRVVVGEEGAAELRQGDRHAWLGAGTELRVADSLELQRGALVLDGTAAHLVAERRHFVIDGRALFSFEAKEPPGATSRETSDLSPEQLLMQRRHLVVAGALGAAVLTLFVVQGSVAVGGAPSGPGGTIVREGERWVADGPPVALTAQVPARAVDAGAPRDVALVVRVMAEGKPLAGAAVKLFAFAGIDALTGQPKWDAVQAATSDARGEVAWPTSPPDAFVTARATGWATAQVRVSRAQADAPTQVDVVLERGLTLEGRTEDARTGQPVVPATVTLTLRRGPTAEAVTVDVDARGRFSAGPLAAGEWELEGVSPGAGKGSARVTLPQQSPTVLLFRPSGFVEGFVQYPDGGAVAGATVVLVGEEATSVESSATGAFSLEAVPGAWKLQARKGEAVGGVAGDLDVLPGATTRAGVIVLQASSRLSGRVTAGGAGVAHAAVIVTPHRGGGEVARAESDENGRYAVPLMAGVYDVIAEAGARTSELEDGLHVSGDTKLDLALGLNGALHGEVVDAAGRPLAGVTVDVRLRDARRRGVSSADGRFSFEDLQPGAWRVRVLRDDERFSAFTTSNVEAGKTATARLVVEAPAVVEGAVGWKCPGAPQPMTVAIFSQWTREQAPVTNGRYRLEVAPGRYWLGVGNEAETCGDSAGDKQLELKAGEPRQLDLVARPHARELEVQVLDPAGQPVHEAMVTFVDAATPSTMLDIAFTDERGVTRHGSSFRDGPATGPVQVLAVKGARSGKSAPFSMGGARRVTVTLDLAASLSLEVEGLAEGRRARVELVTMPSFGFQDTMVLTQPRATFDVPLGRLHITVRADDAVAEGEVVLEAGKPGQLKVTLVPGGAVSGRLVTKDGKPRQGWVGLLTLAGEEASEATPVDGTGRFELRPVPPGTWKLTVMGEDVSRVVQVQSGVTLEVGDFGP